MEAVADYYWNRERRRKWFKKNYKRLKLVWEEWNNSMPKMEPVIVYKDKRRMGYRRRNGLV